MTDRAEGVRALGRRGALLLAGILALLVLSSCAAGPNTAPPQAEPAGFLLGLWHGIILPVTFFISLFTDTVSVYEVANNGNWYDFGFFLGLMIALGGGGASARKRR